MVATNFVSFINEHHHAIFSIANGANLWQNDRIECLTRLKNFIETTWLPFASTTHYVEAGVKEAKICALPERDELVRSMYTTVRSFITYTANEKAKEKQRLTYQQDVERLDGRKSENREKMSIFGSIQSSEILSATMNLMKKTYHFFENARKRVSNLLEKNGNTYKKARVEKKVNVWREKKVVSRKCNKIQKIIGIDLTAKV